MGGGQPDSSVVTEPLTRARQTTIYRAYPVRRMSRQEYRVYVGFDSQTAAQRWVDDGLSGGYLRPPKAMKVGAPDKPKKP